MLVWTIFRNFARYLKKREFIMSNEDMVSAIMPICNLGVLLVDGNSTCCKFSIVCGWPSDEAGNMCVFKL